MENKFVDFSVEPLEEKPFLSKWAKPAEFEGDGKIISIFEFKRADASKGETTSKPEFLDHEGKTYQLFFYDLEADGFPYRCLEVASQNFRDDLSREIYREFGASVIPAGKVCTLKREKEKKVTSQGVREFYKWTVTKVNDNRFDPEQRGIVDTNGKIING